MASRIVRVAYAKADSVRMHMADNVSESTRSKIMSRIRGRGNKSTELKMVEIFRMFGVRGWRRHVRLILNTKSESAPKAQSLRTSRHVRPDFVFRREKTVLFIDGCFWHGCRKHFKKPLSNPEFWESKISRNRERDAANSKFLRKRGWIVVRLWEHDIKFAKIRVANCDNFFVS